MSKISYELLEKLNDFAYEEVTEIEDSIRWLVNGDSLKYYLSEEFLEAYEKEILRLKKEIDEAWIKIEREEILPERRIIVKEKVHRSELED